MTGEEAMQTIKLNVLIVEDNLVNQKVLRKQLQKFGWNISVAGNGQEALEWLKDSVYLRNEKDSSNTEDKHELDIILMDIEMPIMDGLTCARLIRDYARSTEREEIVEIEILPAKEDDADEDEDVRMIGRIRITR